MKNYIDENSNIYSYDDGISLELLNKKIEDLGLVIITDEALAVLRAPTEAEILEKAKIDTKIARDIAVSSIEVTTVAGNIYQGDEVSQGRMSRSIVELTSGVNGTTKTWRLADDTEITVDATELTEALTKAVLAQDALWFP